MNTPCFTSGCTLSASRYLKIQRGGGQPVAGLPRCDRHIDVATPRLIHAGYKVTAVPLRDHPTYGDRGDGYDYGAL